jgi:hypothetical protein
MVFNNNPTQQKGGKYMAYNNTEVDHTVKLHERLLGEKDKLIDNLEMQLSQSISE